MPAVKVLLGPASKRIGGDIAAALTSIAESLALIAAAQVPPALDEQEIPLPMPTTEREDGACTVCGTSSAQCLDYQRAVKGNCCQTCAQGHTHSMRVRPERQESP